MHASHMTPEETKPHLRVPQEHGTQREGKVHFTFKPVVLTPPPVFLLSLS